MGSSEKPTTRRYSASQKEQAVRLVRKIRVETGQQHGAVRRVADQLGYGVESVCKVLQIAPSTYYSAKSRKPSARAVRDAVTAVTVMTIWQANYSVYGVHKMWKALRRAGEDIGRDQVGRIMRGLGIIGARRGAKVFTTRSDDKANRPPDLV